MILADDLDNGPAIEGAGIVAVWPTHYARFGTAGFAVMGRIRHAATRGGLP